MPIVPITNIIRLSGLGVGDQGVVTVTEQDKVVEIPDGVRALPTLGMTFRLAVDPFSELIKKKLFEWWEKRNTQTYDFLVSITDRNFCPLHTYEYQGCSIKTINEDDRELSNSMFYTLNMQVKPYDVIYSRALGKNFF